MSKGNNKLKVAVLYGGKSGEHEVSILSAASVIQHLNQNKYDIIPIAIDKQGHWFVNELSQVYFPTEKQLLLKTPRSVPFLPTSHNQDKTIATNGYPQFDVVFPVIHGTHSEDGCVQGLLELANLPYVGAGVLASAIGMDKDISKRLISAAGIAISDYLVLTDSTTRSQRKQFVAEITDRLQLPVFIKPARQGSSVGIHKVENSEDLLEQINNVFRYDHKIIIEQAVNGSEIELSVLENANYGREPLVSLAGEIKVSAEHSFYSYQAKYIDPNGAELIIPAQLTKAQMTLAQAIAKKVFCVLECEGMARVDLFVEHSSGRILFNEINTIPGFTKISMYPQLWQASGLTYSKLMDALIQLALNRKNRNQNLSNGNSLENVSQ